MREKQLTILKETKKLLVAVSGGESSAIMALHIEFSGLYDDYEKLYVFANTGKESEETLKFLVRLEKVLGKKIHWVEAVVTMVKGIGIEAIEVNYNTASRNGEPFSAVIDKESFTAGFGKLPNSSSPYCSGRLKEVPCHKFAKEYFGTTKYIKAIGMRREDMPKRISMPQAVFETQNNIKYYPLIIDFDLPLTKRQIKRKLKSYGLVLNQPQYAGNCDICPKKSDKKIVQQLRDGIDPSFWIDQELKTKDRFYRGKKSIFDFIELAKKPDLQMSFLDDNSEGCFCGG